MGTFIISENLRPLIKEQFGVETETVGKICDFCLANLPIDFPSTKCRKCPTIFDECLKCREWPRPDSTICHKDHKANNTTFSKEEINSIQMILDKPTIVRILGMSYTQRCRIMRQDVDTDEFFDEYTLDLNDARKFSEGGCPQIANMIDQGYHVILKGYNDCVIIEIASPTFYKNICYRIREKARHHEHSVFKCLVKIFKHGNGWSELPNEYTTKDDALKAIKDVIDEIEKRYEPGGIEFEKCRQNVNSIK